LTTAPVGMVGQFAVNRPLLANAVIIAGLLALAASGAREAGGLEPILEFSANALFVVAAPLAIAGWQPRRAWRRLCYIVIVVLAAGALIAADLGLATAWSAEFAPPAALSAAALGHTLFLIALTPLTQNVARLAIAAPVAATLGVAGALGYFALEPVLAASEAAAGAGLALGLGAAVGASVSADFARYFADGARRRQAAAAAGHAGLAIVAFSVMSVAALFSVQTFKTNFGAVDWRVFWAGFTAALTASTAALFAVTASLALAPIGERAAVDENRRRQWFSLAWRPVRRVLPPTSATAAAAIAGIVVVIALFEAGLATPASLAVFFALIWIAAAVAFVSLRTSILVLSTLTVSAIFARYGYVALGLEPPGMPARLAGLCLTAAAIGYMTVSWRNAGDVWRNARDVAENALSDGLRRFLFVFAMGSASLYVSARSFGWEEGYAAILYFMANAFIAALLAPAFMTVLSAHMRRV